MVGSLAVFACCVTFVCAQLSDPDRWWKSANIYQISPVSFKDSNNDGFGDIQGIISELDYLVETGVDVIFLSPFYKTPFKDFGYDVSNYLKVDEKFGNDDDIKELLTKAHDRGLKVIIDFIPNHTSNEHEWFIKSENREPGFENYYIWHDGIPLAIGVQPAMPNNWQSTYGGSSWQWSDKRQQYYYHAFAKEQPDLNLREHRVIEETEKILAFWLELGVDGFRVDAVSQLYEDAAFVEDPDVVNNLPQTYELVQRWRGFVDLFTSSKGGDNRVLVPQVWNSKIEDLMSYFQDKNGTQRAQVPTNFGLINGLNRDSKATDYKVTIDNYLKVLPQGAVANWFVSIFDRDSLKRSTY